MLLNWKPLQSSRLVNVYYISAVVIILVLAAVAGYLHWRLYQVKKRQVALQDELDQKRDTLRSQANQSIQIIARAFLQGQVGSAEACLRICALMDQLQTQPELRKDYVAIAKMADDIRHIPILEAWKQLPKKQKREYEKFIAQREQDAAGAIREDISSLLGKSF